MLRDLIIKTVVPLSIIGTAVLSFQMGVVVSGNPGLTHAPLGVQLLYACTLFTFGGASLGFPLTGPDLWRDALYVTYFLAPVVSAAAFFELFYVLSRPLLSIDFFVAKQYIVFGYGRVGKASIAAVRKQIEVERQYQSFAHKTPFSRFRFNLWKFKNRVRFIVIDKHVRPSAAGVNLFGSDEFFIKHDLQDASIIKRLNLTKTDGIFVLTDDEWINLGILKVVEKYCSVPEVQNENVSATHLPPIWRGPKFLFTRMNSRDFMRALDEQYRVRYSSSGDPRFFFFNTHMESASQLFDTENPNHVLINEFREFHRWGQGREIHTWIFFGFGRFSSMFCEKLLDDEMFNEEVRDIIIIDKNATHELNLFKIEHADLWRHAGKEKGFSILRDKASPIDAPMEELSKYQNILREHDLSSCLVVFGSNIDTANFNTAIAFKKLFSSPGMPPCNLRYIVRSRDNEADEPALLQQIVSGSLDRRSAAIPLIVVPTYSWMGAYFEDCFNTLNLGLHARVITPSSVQLHWKSVQGSTIHIRLTQITLSGSEIAESFHHSSGLGIVLDELTPDTLYRWEISNSRSENEFNPASWSYPSYFLTKSHGKAAR
jgi:hypothetical protein